MSNFMLLTKMLFKNGYNNGGNKKSKLKGGLLYIVVFVCFIPLMMQLWDLVSKIYDNLEVINQQGIILGLSFSILSFFIFFFGIMYAMSVYYFSQDIEILLPLPFKPAEILGAKFVNIIIYEYLIEAMLFLPVVMCFGVKSSAGAVYYSYALITFLVLPIIPVVLSSLIGMILMSFTGIGKNKDRYRIIVGILGLCIGLGFNFGMQKIGNHLDAGDIQNLIASGNNSMISTVSKIFPTTTFAANALVLSNLRGFLNLIIFLAFNGIAIVLFIAIGQKLYFKGVIGINESHSKRKKLSTEETRRSLSENSHLKAYTIKELKLLVRTPSYFLNCVLMNFLWPVFLLIPIFAGSGSQDLTKVRGFISKANINNEFAPIALAGALVFIIFVAGTNAVSCTSISREGKNIYFMKFIPVSYTVQIMSKILSGVIMGLIGMTMLVLLGLIVFKVDIVFLLFVIALGLLGILFINLVGIIIDLNFPKLSWDNEQKAVKQNFNVFISMIISLGVGGLIIFLNIKFQLSFYVTFISMFVIFAVIDSLLFYIIKKFGIKLLDKIQQ